MNPTSIARALHLGLTIAEAAAAGVAAAQEGRRLVQSLAAQGRDPTPEEWQQLQAALADAHRRIQDA
ncbi:MAG: hypothetical protein RLY86_682 [Pseudomonadota bacterium]|jgi:hypothetical protein